MTDFDKVYDRSASNSVKWDKYQGQDILPMWVADMDFRSPSPVIDAIKEKAEEGILSYGNPPPELSSVFINRMERMYGWQVRDEDIVFINGVVPALNMACRALVGKNEALITATPIYTPFLEVGENNDVKLFKIKAEEGADGWKYPLEALEGSLRNHPEIKMLLLCNPFNPIGRSLRKIELIKIVSLCKQYDVWICSDEIHCELVFDDTVHFPVANLSAEAADISISLMAPTKTFNLAGVGGSIAIINNQEVREKFCIAKRGMCARVSTLTFAAMLAAYRDCEAWKEDLLQYLQDNRDYLLSRMSKIDGIRMNHVESTYLAWLDVRSLGLNDPQHFFESAGVGLSPGSQYEGPEYMRLNFACPRSVLADACDRIEKAVRNQ
ncbi:MAG: PatB family C-S lyase [Pseudomonadales bacterium]|nr:PatB family C-S lyase [Pseudomonadales bacterium]